MPSRGMRPRAQGLSVAVAVLMSACGGGGGGDPAPTPTPPPPTQVPESLAVTAPSGAEASAEIQFGNSASSLSGLTFSWDFGDGKTSTEASPKHSFAKGGDYEVVLKVSNAAGASREVRTRLSVNNLANVKGLVCSGASDTGWCWQQPRPTGNARNDLAVLNATTAFNIGENGEIFKTTDAGASWKAIPSGTTANLLQIAFSSDKDVWIVGTFGALLRSSDGGATWALSKMADADGYYTNSGALLALDANTAVWNAYYETRYTLDGGKTWSYAANRPSAISPKGVFWSLSSYNGQLTKSTDFGKSVSTVLNFAEAGYSVNAASFKVIDEKLVMVPAILYRYDSSTYSYSYKPVIRRSEDGGATWTRVEPTGIDAGDTGYYAPQILRASLTDQTVVAVFGGKVYRSGDGGSSWQKGGQPSAGYSASYGETVLLGAKTLVVPTYRGVYRSEDLGQTWVETPIGSTANASFSALRKIDDNTVSIRATDGSGYLSTDQGKTWKQILAVSANQLPSNVGAAFVDGKHGYLLGGQGELSETTDGGLTWKSKLPGLTQGYGDLQFANDKVGWLLLGDGRLSQTVDGGASWGSAVRVGQAGFRRIGVVDDKRAWGSYSYYYSSPTFAVTADAGKSWSDVTAPNGAQSLYLGSEQTMLAYGGNGMVAVSADAGKTWSQRYTGTPMLLNKLAAQEAGSLWIVGDQGVVRRSSDKGQTWSEVNLGTGVNLIDIAWASPKVGWIVGSQGTVYATLDGGKTWVRQATGTQRALTRLVVADPKTAWILGEYGTLLATGNGGF